LDKNVDHVAVLIHRTPQVLALAVDHHEDLVQEPGVAESTPSAFQGAERSQGRTSGTTAGPSRMRR
jgi:hypothetical protein